MKKLLSYIGEYKIYFLLAPVLTVLESAAELILPFLMGRIIDQGISTENTRYILITGGLMIAISLCGLLIGRIGARVASTASQGYGYNLRQAMFAKIQSFSFADIDHFSTASLVTRCTMDVRQIQEVVLQIIRMLVRGPSMLIISMVICIRLHAGLSVVYWVAIPVLLAVITFIMRVTRTFFIMMQEKVDRLNSSVQENMIAIRVVKTFVRGAYEKAKFKTANDDLTSTSIGASIRIALMHPSNTIIFNLATMALYWFGGHLVGNGKMLDGSLLTYIAYLNNILMSVMMFNMVLTRMSRAKVCVERCNKILDYKSSIQSASSVPGKEEISGGIRFENVSFSYPSVRHHRKALDRINLDIHPGEFVAIVGKTGSGKTSLVNMVPRFYDPDEGCVYIDGKDLRNYDLSALRENIGIVLQNNLLFSGSIRDNLLWGNPEADDTELLAACKDAQAYNFISQMSEGLNTKIDQGGTNVSGGQRQRLCIARAMLKRPKILILDDSTSAVDSATESRIRETFYGKYKDTTVLLVAQRISSVQYADRIIVMDHGKIHGIGTHEELLQTDKIYKAIYDSQQDGGDSNVQ